MKLYKEYPKGNGVSLLPCSLSDLKAALAEHGYIAVKTDRITSVMHLVEELHVTSRDAECELGMLIQAAQEDLS